MSRSRKLVLVLAAVVGVGAGGLGIAQAVGQGPPDDAGARPGSDEPDERVIGPGAERARSAAVEAVGGGRVVGLEREDERGVAWEVEVVRNDGSEVEVELDGSFERVSVDHEDANGEADDADEAADDERDDDD